MRTHLDVVPTYAIIKSRGNRKTVSPLLVEMTAFRLQNERRSFYFPYYSVQDQEINHTENVIHHTNHLLLG